MVGILSVIVALGIALYVQDFSFAQTISYLFFMLTVVFAYVIANIPYAMMRKYNFPVSYKPKQRYACKKCHSECEYDDIYCHNCGEKIIREKYRTYWIEIYPISSYGDRFYSFVNSKKPFITANREDKLPRLYYLKNSKGDTHSHTESQINFLEEDRKTCVEMLRRDRYLYETVKLMYDCCDPNNKHPAIGYDYPEYKDFVLDPEKWEFETIN